MAILSHNKCEIITQTYRKGYILMGERLRLFTGTYQKKRKRI